MANQFAYIEVVNSNVDNVFNNTNDNDIVIYGSAPNQTIHFGIRSNDATLPTSVMRLTASNISITGDITTDRRLVLNGVRLGKRAAAGIDQNVTEVVGNVLSIGNSLAELQIRQMLPTQTRFRFLSSNLGEVAILTNDGLLQLAANDSEIYPSYTWTQDTTTGMYHRSQNAIGFTSGGTTIMTLSNNALTTKNIFASNLSAIDIQTPNTLSAKSFLGMTDSFVAPAYSWNSDPDTGMYRAAENTIGFISGGTVVATLSNTTATFSNVTASNVNVLGVILMNSNDSSNAPGFSWNGDSNTGMYHAAKNVIGFVSGGNLVATMSNTTATFSNISASNLSGNGAAVTNLNAANVATGTLAVARGGTGTTTSTGTGNVVLSDSPTLTGIVTVTGHTYCQNTILQYLNTNAISTSRVTVVSTIATLPLTISITPKRNNSKIKVEFYSSMCSGGGGKGPLILALHRSINGAAYTNLTTPGYFCYQDPGWTFICPFYYDSPNTTLPITYQLKYNTVSTGIDTYIVDINQAYGWNLIEIAQ